MTRRPPSACAGSSCQAFPGYTALVDQNSPGNNILQYSTLQEAFNACSLDDTCLGFNSLYFYTKTVVSANVSTLGVCLYVKTFQQGSPPPSAGRTLRLSDGNNSTGWSFGRLEVLYNGAWGTVWCVPGLLRARCTTRSSVTVHIVLRLTSAVCTAPF